MLLPVYYVLSSSDVDLVDNLSDGDEDLDSTERLEVSTHTHTQAQTHNINTEKCNNHRPV